MIEWCDVSPTNLCGTGMDGRGEGDISILNQTDQDKVVSSTSNGHNHHSHDGQGDAGDDRHDTVTEFGDKKVSQEHFGDLDHLPSAESSLDYRTRKRVEEAKSKARPGA